MNNRDKYNIVERTEKELETLSKEELLAKAETSLEELNESWSNYSYDCCGHAHTFYTLQIDYLKELINCDVN